VKARYAFAACAVVFAGMISALFSAPKPAGPAKRPVRRAEPPVPANKSAVILEAAGLKQDSPRTFRICRGGKCLAVGRAGRPTIVNPGKYDIQVGFPSGWVAHAVDLKGAQRYVIPTGVFTFAPVTPPQAAWTVPQELYHNDTYLGTGYQGQTVRLMPGNYRVCYQGPADESQAIAPEAWHVIGPFPNNTKNNQGYKTVFAPEKDLKVVPAKVYKLGAKTLKWRRIVEHPELLLSTHVPRWGVVYAATELDSDADRDVQLILTFRGGIKVWLNGKLVKAISTAKRYDIRRETVFTRLRKGRNELFVKAFTNRAYSSRYYWPLGVVAVKWNTYEAVVKAGAAAEIKGLKSPRAKVHAPPVAGIRGIVFCQVPDLPNGKSGLHMEQFRIVRRPNKARICTLIPASPNGVVTDLTGKHFVSAIQPDISYDATKVLFSAKRTNKPGEHWNIYEMKLDGTGLRAITKNDMNDCIDPCYLPTGKILFSSGQPGFRDEYDRDIAKLLFTCNPDGSGAEQITFNLSGDTASIVLHDGRILFTSWQHHGDHQGTAGVFALCTVNPDGTGFMPFTGNHREMNNTKSYAQQLTDGRVVVVESAGHRHYNAGGLAAVHPRKPLTAIKVLTPGQIYNGHNLAGRYASPYPLPDGGMLCSYSPGRATGMLRTDPFEEPHLGVYRFDFKAGRAGKLVYDDPKCQDYDAIAIYPRPVPPIIPSMVIPGAKTGTFLCVNPYLSDRKPTKRAVVGELPPAKTGEIRAVRVVEGFGIEDKNRKKHRDFVIDMLQMSFGSGSNSGNNFEQKRILGYAPCEPDGSFHIEVPSDTVLSLQTLDARGMAIETQLTWVWVKPGEKRMCIGCHENRETALANLDCLAMHRRPHFVAPPPEKRRTVDFRRDIMPIIVKRCVKCHGKATPAGGLHLPAGFELVFHRTGHTGRRINGAFFNQAYESLLQAGPNRVGRLVISNSARHSPLIWRLYGKQLDFTDSRVPYKKPCRQMPPEKPLTEAEKKLFVEWIDIGAQWDNIPGEDPLPGFDSGESYKMGKALEARLRKPIADPKEAFTVRCLECHDNRRMMPMMKMSPQQIAPMVRRMVAKRPSWIHKSEIPLVLKHIAEQRKKAQAKRTPPAKKKPAPAKKKTAPAKKAPARKKPAPAPKGPKAK